MIDGPAHNSPNDLEAHLGHFGLEQFRPGQEEVISTILGGRDCLCVMPTGGGKSLCYQLPALVAGGVTLVVSPLIALMKDQVDQLRKLELPVTFLNSTLTSAEMFQRLDEMAAGQYRLVYVVPERFRSRRFVEAAKQANVQILAVDEAHCISEWGHDFRPDYARLGQFRKMIGDPPTIALTATATDVVRQDIVARLDLREPRVFVTGFARPNLFYGVDRPSSEREKNRRLVGFLDNVGGAGIIYASSRRRVEDLADFLSNQTKRKVVAYHAGLLPEQRKLAQEQFKRGQAEIIVATNAFGMGIDKADVRFVVHFNMPGTLEGYYQEAGRAGRDGRPSRCLMLYHASDRRILEYFIESSYPSPDIVEQVLDFLRSVESDPIELTQQEIKDRLSLPVGPDAVGACEELLDKAGAIERLVATENRASVRIISDLPTVVDLLPKRAERRRKVLRAAERIVGSRRNEQVFFRMDELIDATGLTLPVVRTALRELNKLECFTFVPPFRGRAVRVLDRDTPFAQLPIDFKHQQERKQAEYDKINRVVAFVNQSECRQRDILNYFGEADATDCGHCDNCIARGIVREGASPEITAAAPQRRRRRVEIDDEALATIVRMALSGVARASRRCPCGKRLVAQMLCGSEAAAVKRLHFDQLSTFGLLGALRQTEVVDLLDALLAAGLLKQTEPMPNRPVVELSPDGDAFMRGESEQQLPPLPPDLAEALASRVVTSLPAPSTPKPADPTPPPIPHDATKTSPEPPRPVSSPPENASTKDDRPRHYWTWRLLDAGFTARECAAIRRMTLDEVLDDVVRAEQEGLAFPLEAVVPKPVREKLDLLVAENGTPRVDELLPHLPDDARYEEVALYVRRRALDGLSEAS